MAYDINFINRVLSLVMEDAHRARENAAYSGSFGDGGYSLTEGKVNGYRCGLNHCIPNEWKHYADIVTKQLEQEKLMQDPEYEEYVRLSKKFGGNV